MNIEEPIYLKQSKIYLLKLSFKKSYNRMEKLGITTGQVFSLNIENFPCNYDIMKKNNV